MLLSDCELLPGVIVDTKDPNKLGRIKCVIPGYVDYTFFNFYMPWVRPLGMFNHQSFSKMMNGYKVWVLVNKLNYNEFWYFPFFELNDVAKAYLDPVYDKDQPEVLIAHNCGGNHATLTYDENNGFSEKIGQNHIDMHPDGKIELLGQQAQVVLDGSHINIGHTSNGTYQEAVLGQELKKILDNLKGAFSELKEKAGTDPHTACLQSGFQQGEKALSNLDAMLSDNIEIN